MKKSRTTGADRCALVDGVLDLGHELHIGVFELLQPKAGLLDLPGEARDLRAGQCMGAWLEYAARANRPLMIYVFSDGSLSSNGIKRALIEAIAQVEIH